MDGWTDFASARGPLRRDGDRDGEYDHAEAAGIMDAWWDPMIHAMFDPGLGGRDVSTVSMQSFHNAPGSTGSAFQGGFYSLRTAILPFVFIFNPAMLLIGNGDWVHTALVASASLLAILLFTAAVMNRFVTRSRLWESAVLLLVCFTLFRPDWWLNQFSAPYEEAPASELLTAIEDYRRELVPLIVPVTLIRHHVRARRVPYLAGQSYLEPYPRELMLRNQL